MRGETLDVEIKVGILTIEGGMMVTITMGVIGIKGAHHRPTRKMRHPVPEEDTIIN
jgi:hypothetical protein